MTPRLVPRARISGRASSPRFSLCAYQQHDGYVYQSRALALDVCFPKCTALPPSPRSPYLQYMLAFDDVWPADLPNLRPLRLNIPRPLIAAGDDGQPVYLMPMHRQGRMKKRRRRRRRRGRAVARRDEQEEQEACLVPPPLRRDGDETARRRDR